MLSSSVGRTKSVSSFSSGTGEHSTCGFEYCCVSHQGNEDILDDVPTIMGRLNQCLLRATKTENMDACESRQCRHPDYSFYYLASKHYYMTVQKHPVLNSVTSYSGSLRITRLVWVIVFVRVVVIVSPVTGLTVTVVVVGSVDSVVVFSNTVWCWSAASGGAAASASRRPVGLSSV